MTEDSSSATDATPSPALIGDGGRDPVPLPPPALTPSRRHRLEAWLTFIARPALLIYWPLLFYLTHSPTSPSVAAVFHQIEAVKPDKWAHVIAFSVLTILAVFARLAGTRATFLTNLHLGCVLVALYGIGDELTQGAFGRTVDGGDITANFAAVSGVYIILLLSHPDRRTLPWSVLLARVIFATIVPLTGLVLFNENVGADVKIWKIVPQFMGYIRGDYVAHFLVSLLATLLLAATAPLGVARSRRRANAMLVILFMLATGPIIEWMQHQFSKRGAEWEDVQAHTWGVFIAVVIWALWRLIRPLFVRLGWLTERDDAIDALATGDAMITADDAPIHAAAPITDGAAASAPVAASPVAATAAAAEQASADNHRFVGHALVVGIMTLISRFTGLVRDAVLAAALGLTATADAFSIGFLVPNLFRRLFGEGALTAAFIPIYTNLLKQDRLTARRLASLCIAVMLVFLGGLTLVGELILLAMLNAREWTSDTALALQLTMIMLPYMPMICIVALVGGILQVHGRFGAPAAAPIFLNVVMIAGTLAAVSIAGVDPAATGADADARTTHAVIIVSWTVLIAGLVQLLWQLGMVLRLEKFTTIFTGAGPAFRQMLAMMVPMFIGLGVFQINTLFDYLIAFTLSQKTGGSEQLHLLGMTLNYPMTTGDVAALTWAQRLYQFPLGVFGIAVATAIFPALARAAAAQSPDDSKPTADANLPLAASANFQTILHHGLRLTFFIGLPASIGLILLRIPITRLIYERGQFGLEESQRVAFVMIGYAAVVWAYSMTHVLTRAFYALKDSRTPLTISIRMVALNLILNLILIWPLGVAGLAWASAISASMQVVLMCRALRRHVSVVIGEDVRRSWKMTAGLTLAMTAVLAPMTLLHDAATMTRAQSAMQLFILLPVGAGIVLLGAMLLKADELKWLRRRSVK